MAPNPRDVETSWRARTYASIRRAIGASMLAFALASMLSAAARSAAARPVPVAAVAGDDANTCKQASGDVAIAACTRAIASGRYAGHDLAKLHYDRALEYANKGDYDRAIQDFGQAIKINPNHVGPLYSRGRTYSNKGLWARAIQDYGEAIKLSPNYVRAISNRGNAYFAKRQYDRAIQDYDQAIKLDPNEAIPLNNRGNAYYQIGQVD